MADPVVAISVIIKWSNQEFLVDCDDSPSLFHLKEKIFFLTNVPPERQKLMGIKYNVGAPAETILLSTLNLKPKQKILMTGTADALIVAPVEEEDDVINDFSAEHQLVAIKDQQIYLDKIAIRAKQYVPVVLNPPRPGKKLLVLDIDYTFFDFKSTASNPLILRRPYIDFLLETIYPYYDICIWSATNMKWIQTKMQELQLEKSDKWKITAYFCSRAMITVHTEKYGVINTKPLPVVWSIFKEFYSPLNTIMFDDLGRNFLMNPANGLRIKAFRNAPTEGSKDKELLELTKYLMLLHQNEADYGNVDHSKWVAYIEKHRNLLQFNQM